MKIKTLLASLALTMMVVSPALAASFSFNNSSADEMVEAAKAEGITLDKAIADAIVKYRTDNGKITSEDDLAKVPGMTNQLIQQLYPVEEDGDLLFDPSAVPGMKGY